MDPTAQTNNPNPQGDAAKSPIEPGQFVVAGADPVPPQPQPAPPAQQAPIGQPQQPASPPQPMSPPQPRPGFSLAQDKNLAQSFPTPPPQPQVPSPPPPPPPQPDMTMQPDPTPFTGPGQQGSVPTQQPPASKMKKIKLIVILIAVLILIGIVAAVAWFFILNKPQTTAQNVKTQNVQETIEPTPLPQTPTNGFGNLPQATDSGQASASGQLQQPPLNQPAP